MVPSGGGDGSQRERAHLPVIGIDAVLMDHGFQGVRVRCRVKRQRQRKGAIKAVLGIGEENAPVASNAERSLKERWGREINS